MLNFNKLLAQLKQSLYKQIPNQLWNQLYQQLTDLTISIGSTRYTILLVKRNIGEITIENGFHNKIVKIPQSLDNINDVDFKKPFYHLPSQLQNDIKNIIQKTIDKAANIT